MCQTQIIASAEGVMFFARVHVLVGWLLSRILSGFPHKNLGSRMDPSSEQTTLTLCVDLNEEADPGFL